MAEIPLPNNRVSLHALGAILQHKNMLAALEVFHAVLGDVFQIPVPGFNPIMLVGPTANRFVLVQQRDDLRWRAEHDPLTRLLRHGVLVEDGESHDSLRRQINPALHRSMLKNYVEATWQCTDTVSSAWQAEPLDMLVEMRRIGLLVLMKTLFHVDFEPEMARLWQSILRLLDYISPGLWVMWRDVPRPGYQRALRRFDAYLQQIITRRRHSTPHDDLLGLLIATGMSDDLIRDQLVTMIIAGHDTSTALLTWVLYVLSSKPEVQSKARQEINTVLGSSQPDYAHLTALRYLDQVMNETLRLYPPIHLGSRIAACDLEFQGYRIPAGRRVLYSIYLTHRDARYWRHPTDFIPERFSPEQSRHPYTFIPFGGGPRNCIGMAFAQVEVKIVLARILQRFELEFTGHPVRLHMGATLEPRPGVRVKVRRRF